MLKTDIKRALVLGKGISGEGAMFALGRSGADCDICDESDLDDKLTAKSGYTAVVISPSVPRSHRVFSLAAAAGAEVISELELGGRMCDKPVIAVTGTNGKTTTSKLIGKMFSYSRDTVVTGNVGRSFAADCVDEHDIYVVEASSFQLENVRLFTPHVAIVTNITPDHLDRHGTFAAYAAAKLNIVRAQRPDDYCVLSADDIPLAVMENFYPNSNVVYTSLTGRVNGAYLLGERIFWFDELICRRSDIAMQGDHNVANALAAVAATKLFGLKNSEIRRALGEFRPDEHRITFVRSVRGVAFYDDSKATNADACVKAMRTMPDSFALIAGGSDKGCEFDTLFSSPDVRPLATFVTGATAGRIEAAAERCGYTAVVRCKDMTEAVDRAYASGAKCVLLSPAAASFDTYGSYKERGMDFRRAVAEIEARETRG